MNIQDIGRMLWTAGVKGDLKQSNCGNMKEKRGRMFITDSRTSRADDTGRLAPTRLDNYP